MAKNGGYTSSSVLKQCGDALESSHARPFSDSGGAPGDISKRAQSAQSAGEKPSPVLGVRDLNWPLRFGHCYFITKDEQAQVDCVMFSTSSILDWQPRQHAGRGSRLSDATRRAAGFSSTSGDASRRFGRAVRNIQAKAKPKEGCSTRNASARYLNFHTQWALSPHCRQPRCGTC
jgi:hypothetical protein